MVVKNNAKNVKVKVKIKGSTLEPQSNLPDFKSSKMYEQSIMRAFDKFQVGLLSLKSLRWSAQNCVVDRLKEFKVHAIESFTFNRRITALKWHPTKPTYLAIGSKFGEVLFRNVTKDNVDQDLKESRRNTSRYQAITCFSYDPFTDSGLFMSSVDGTVCHWDYEVNSVQELLNTNDNYVSWYCSVATTAAGMIAAGDSKGVITLLDKSTRKPVLKEKIHETKVNTAEFSSPCGWMMATSSVDRTVKLWDIRMLGKEKPGKKKMDLPLFELQHNHPVNSAYFSRTDRGRLLTTDQHMQLRVYSVPSFALETTIYQPHRQFQHLTPIKATWHPLTDLIVVGRYPDPTWPNYEEDVRCVDIIDCKSGAVETKLIGVEAIMSLNEFNMNGEILASSMGLNVAYWKAKTPREGLPKNKRKPDGKDSDDDNDDDDDDTDANKRLLKRKRQTKNLDSKPKSRKKEAKYDKPSTSTKGEKRDTKNSKKGKGN